MMRWTGSGLRVVVVGAALAAAAARAETAATPAEAAPADAEMALTTEPAGDIPYDPAGRRDPFRPPRAVVEDDQGLGYIVHVGTPIGPNGGQVRGIERGRVLITEDSVDYYGEHRDNQVTMELRTTERGK